MTLLSLSNNHLNTKTSAELAQAFASIPAGVTLLSLSANGLMEKTAAELVQILASIPAVSEQNFS